MKYLIEKTYLVLFFITIFLLSTKAFCKESEIKYSRNNISNYFIHIQITQFIFKLLNSYSIYIQITISIRITICKNNPITHLKLLNQ